MALRFRGVRAAPRLESLEESRKVSFFVPKHPVGENHGGKRGASWHKSHAQRQLWRKLVAAYCPRLDYPLLEPVVARLTWFYKADYPEDTRARPDCDNMIGASKQVWDALEDHGILWDDNEIEPLIPAREPALDGATGIRVELWEG